MFFWRLVETCDQLKTNEIKIAASIKTKRLVQFVTLKYSLDEKVQNKRGTRKNSASYIMINSKLTNVVKLV